MGYRPEDAVSKILRNGSILPQHYKASQPRRQRLEQMISLLRAEVSSRRLAVCETPDVPFPISTLFCFILLHVTPN